MNTKFAIWTRMYECIVSIRIVFSFTYVIKGVITK